jgi:hypothetical protein
MNKTYLLRLLLDALAAGLLLAALAYYWLDNTAHELIGTGFFLLLIVHNAFNRRWYGAIRKARAPRTVADVVLTLSLLAAVLVLLVTSLMISRTVFSFLQLGGGFSARQVHLFAAYWSLAFVAIHLGLRWQRVMNAVRSGLRISGKSPLRTAALRVAAAAIAACGLKSSFVMGVGTKLSLQMSLDGWDFETSAPGFFLNWAAVAGLYIFVAHYTMMGLQKFQRKESSIPTPSSSTSRMSQKGLS